MRVASGPPFTCERSAVSTKTLEELIDHFYPIYGEKKLSPPKVKDLSGDISRLLNMTHEGEEAVRDLLLRFMNTKLSKRDLEKILLKVLFGKEHMNKGKRLGEDGLIQEVSAVKCLNAVEKDGSAEYSFIILEGALAGERRKNIFSHEKLMGVGSNAGLRGLRQREYNPRELVQFLMNANIQKSDGEIMMHRLDGQPYKDTNSKLKLQRKPGNRECGVDKNIPCFLCKYGYDTCPVATHPDQWKPKECDICGAETLHDKYGCIVCKEREYRDLNYISDYEEIL